MSCARIEKPRPDEEATLARKEGRKPAFRD
jgi:hypothetical protein